MSSATAIASRPASIAVPRPSRYAILAAASLLLAALSLAIQAAPSYDPWAWIIWGREITHLALVTTGGPTWKPLPVIFTTVFAPFGAAAPDLWLVVARAGGIMAIALAAVAAARLVRSDVPGRALPAIAAALAGIGLLGLYQYAASVMQGESEGLLAALVLLAILRYFDGAPRQALLLGFAAALIRPEVWPFLALYGMLLWRRDPGTRWLVLALFALIGALWFLPEVWGSGSLLRGVRWAENPRHGSPALASCPFCSEVSGSAWPLVTMPFKAGVVLALVEVARRWRHQAPTNAQLIVAIAALIGLGWILEEAVLTQIGFSGSDRYLIAPVAVLIMVGAVGWAWAFQRPRSAFVLVGVVAALTVLCSWSRAASRLRHRHPASPERDPARPSGRRRPRRRCQTVACVWRDPDQPVRGAARGVDARRGVAADGEQRRPGPDPVRRPGRSGAGATTSARLSAGGRRRRGANLREVWLRRWRAATRRARSRPCGSRGFRSTWHGVSGSRRGRGSCRRRSRTRRSRTSRRT